MQKHPGKKMSSIRTQKDQDMMNMSSEGGKLSVEHKSEGKVFQ